MSRETPPRSAAFKGKNYCFHYNLEIITTDFASCVYPCRYLPTSKQAVHDLPYSKGALGFIRNTKFQLSV